jgi:formylglycine-generating enzyme required for sulfatase activity
LVTDAIKGSDHMFYAHLIDAKESTVAGRGSYIRTSVVESDLPRVSSALAKQLGGQGRKRSGNVTPQQKWFEPEMVFVEGGTFMMGCTAEQEANCANSEKPAHSVTVSSFSIGRYELTQAQWKAVMSGVAGTSAADVGEIYSWKTGNCGSVPCDDQRPAEYMDWYEAVKFCNELSKKAGLEAVYTIDGTTVTWITNKKGYRLPTEAEWEYAARGCKGDGNAGNATCENLLYSGSSNVDEVGWHPENALNTTHLVGQKKPNVLGIYDMSGNVWEWVYDWYGAYSSTAATNPTGPNSGGTYRVMRSGDWSLSAADWARVSSRFPWRPPTGRGSNIGFRVVLPAQ